MKFSKGIVIGSEHNQIVIVGSWAPEDDMLIIYALCPLPVPPWGPRPAAEQ